MRLDRITEIGGKPSNGTVSGWYINALRGSAWDDMNGSLDAEYRGAFGDARINWVIAGGESGPGARPCDIDWIRSIVEQCRAARVPAFCKQLGSRPTSFHNERCSMAWGWDDSGEEIERWYRPADRKGGDPSEWPADLSVREFPKCLMPSA